MRKDSLGRQIVAKRRKNTAVRSLCSCGHSILYKSSPYDGDIVWCVRCDDATEVITSIVISSPVRSIVILTDDADT